MVRPGSVIPRVRAGDRSGLKEPARHNTRKLYRSRGTHHAPGCARCPGGPGPKCPHLSHIDSRRIRRMLRRQRIDKRPRRRKSDLCQLRARSLRVASRETSTGSLPRTPHAPGFACPDACMGCARAEPGGQSRASRAGRARAGRAEPSREGRGEGMNGSLGARGVRIVLSPELTGGGLSSVPSVSENDKPTLK